MAKGMVRQRHSLPAGVLVVASRPEGQYIRTKLVLPVVPQLLPFVEGANTMLAEPDAGQSAAHRAMQPLVTRLAHAHLEPKLAQTCT
jgi:hypothetical protein